MIEILEILQAELKAREEDHWLRENSDSRYHLSGKYDINERGIRTLKEKIKDIENGSA